MQRGFWAPTEYLIWDRDKPRETMVELAGPDDRVTAGIEGLSVSVCYTAQRKGLCGNLSNIIRLYRSFTSSTVHTTLYSSATCFGLLTKAVCCVCAYRTGTACKCIRQTHSAESQHKTAQFMPLCLTPYRTFSLASSFLKC